MFVLSLEGGKSFCIIERSRKVTKEMVLSHASVRWFANTMEECSLSKGRREFCKMDHDGNKALFAYWCSNAFGRYLELTDYGGSGW